MSSSNTITKSFVLGNELGLHARPAGMLVKAVKPFDVDVQVQKDDMTVSGKSILELIMLAAEQGTSLTVTMSGADAEVAMEKVQHLFDDNFGEE